VNIPADVKNILEKACNDCHSNNTVYPWYTNIQPLGWWINHHVDEGKHEVNFSEFNTYKIRRKLRKFDEIGDEVKEHEMPLSSYTLIHKNAELTAEEQVILINWAVASKASIDTVKAAEEPKK
jgi:Haem-binding domain